MILPKIKLSEIQDNYLYYEFKSEAQKYEGSFIEVKKKVDYVSIKVDIFSRIPFYYFIHKREIYGNSSFIDLTKEIKNKKYSLSLNNVAIASFLKNNSFLENSTYFNEIHRVPAGSCLNFYYKNGSYSIDQYYNFKQNKIEGNDISHISNEYTNLLSKNINNYLIENKFNKTGISLTGGFDSRMILCILESLNLKPIAYHYGHKNSDDFKLTKILSQNYNLENNIIEWKDMSYFKKNSDQIFYDTDFMLPLHHCHMHESIMSQKETVDTVFYGHFMDMQMQSHFYNKKFDSNSSNKDVRSLLFNMWCGNKSAFSVLNVDIFEKIFSRETVEMYKSNIKNMIDKFSYLNSDKQYEIHYLLNQSSHLVLKLFFFFQSYSINFLLYLMQLIYLY